MKNHRFFSQKHYTFIFLAFILVSLLFAGYRIYRHASVIYDEGIITESLKDRHFYITDAQKLLNLKYLSDSQKARIYGRLSDESFAVNDYETFLDSTCYAIFYNQKAENEEQAVYYYALLAKYYLMIGADKSGYETIVKARKIKNFYTIEDPAIQLQALSIYGRYLIAENDFEDAEKALETIRKDASILKGTRPELNAERIAMAFEAYVTLMQGQTKEAKDLADYTYRIYFQRTEQVTASSFYDFLLPIIYVQTQAAIRNHQYEDAIEYNSQYSRLCKRFNFIMKKTQLTKEVLFALPDTMKTENQILYDQLAIDADILAQSFLDNYTDLTDERLSSILSNLEYSAELSRNAQNKINMAFFIVIAVLLTILLFFFLYSQVQIDGLTKLRNRRALNMRVGRLATAGRKYSAIMLDIDNFKHLNDTYGHDYGDLVLRGIAQILLESETRTMKCYRYGGEEMVAICEHMDLVHTVKAAEAIRSEIAAKKWPKGVTVTASFGVGMEMVDSIKAADTNMYIAKRKGKNLTAFNKDGKFYLAERRLDIRNPMPDKY